MMTILAALATARSLVSAQMLKWGMYAGVLGAAWLAGYMTCHHFSRTAFLKAENAALTKQVADTETILTNANKRADVSVMEAFALQEKINVFQARLKSNPACSLRLLDVRGLQPLATAASRGTPAATRKP